MTKFRYETAPELPDRAFVNVDGKYDVVIIRTDEGLVVDVYPDGWDAPIETMAIHDNDAVVEKEEAV